MRKRWTRLLSLAALLVTVCTVACSGEKEQLVILNMNQHSRFKDAKAMFEKRYPDVEIVVKECLDPRVTGTWMMSPAGEVDLVSTMELFLPLSPQQYLAAGAVEDLTQYPEIIQCLESYREGLFSALQVDGKLIAIPEYIMPTAWEMNEALAAEMGIAAPEGHWTWSDLAAIGEQVSAYNAAHGTGYFLLRDNPYAPAILTQLNANAISVMEGEAFFMKPSYREGMEAWKQIVQSGLVYDRRKGKNAAFDPAEVTLFSFDEMLDYAEMGDAHYILPPAFDEETKFPLSLYAHMLCANSRHKEEAAYFMSCFFSPEVVRHEAIEQIGPWFTALDEQASLWQGTGREVSEGNTQLWYALLERGCMEMRIGDILLDQWETLYPQMIGEDITVEQFLMECQGRASMMLGE